MNNRANIDSTEILGQFGATADLVPNAQPVIPPNRFSRIASKTGQLLTNPPQIAGALQGQVDSFAVNIYLLGYEMLASARGGVQKWQINIAQVALRSPMPNFYVSRKNAGFFSMQLSSMYNFVPYQLLNSDGMKNITPKLAKKAFLLFCKNEYREAVSQIADAGLVDMITSLPKNLDFEVADGLLFAYSQPFFRSIEEADQAIQAALALAHWLDGRTSSV